MENEKRTFGGKVSPEKAWKILKSQGLDVTVEQAKEILEFLRKLANIVVANYLRRKEKRDNYGKEG